MSGRLEHAIMLAADYHDGQKDKAGAPYIAHICAVVAGVQTEDEKIVAALHDIIEDTTMDLNYLEERFGVSIAAAVAALTKNAGEEYSSYLLRVKSNPLARAVKIADLKHNMDPCRGVPINPKYEAALMFLESAP